MCYSLRETCKYICNKKKNMASTSSSLDSLEVFIDIAIREIWTVLDKDNVGLLNMSLYGTRDAAINWQKEVERQMQQWGFKRGKYNPCLYHNKRLNIKTMVHGDDVFSAGPATNFVLFISWRPISRSRQALPNPGRNR